MLTDKEVVSLIALLDDDDQEIVKHVEDKLLSLGVDVVTLLENEWNSIHNIEHQQKLENIIHKIQFEDQVEQLREWSKTPEQDLLDGLFIIARYKYPELLKQTIINEIDKIRLDIWLEIRPEFGAYEKIRIMNHILYNVYGFKGNTDHYHDPSNSFINNVLESKRGNPIMLAVVYMLVAQRLNMPIYGVNLPQHFVLGYKDENGIIDISDAFSKAAHPTVRQSNGKILFYINAFNNGSVFSKANLEQFLKQIQIEPRLEFFEPCSNIDIIKRVLRNLSVAYEKVNKPHKVHEIHRMLSVLGEPPLDHFEDTTPDEFDSED
jgi:regulator of sirC expression with transglutaminase-like and TPR domain